MVEPRRDGIRLLHDAFEAFLNGAPIDADFICEDFRIEDDPNGFYHAGQVLRSSVYHSIDAYLDCLAQDGVRPVVELRLVELPRPDLVFAELTRARADAHAPVELFGFVCELRDGRLHRGYTSPDIIGLRRRFGLD